jgi:hypothetical protein
MILLRSCMSTAISMSDVGRGPPTSEHSISEYQYVTLNRACPIVMETY